MTRKKILWLVLPIQLFVILLAVLAYVAQQMKYDGYEILLFDRLILRHMDAWSMIAAMVAETVMFLLLAIWCRGRKLLRLVSAFLSVVCCLIGLFALAADGWTIEGDIVIYDYDEFEPDIVIENWSWLLAGGSDVYESENGILLRRVGSAGGDDGYQPLADSSRCRVTVDKGGILYEYENGSGSQSKWRLFLAYRDGHFIEGREELVP